MKVLNEMVIAESVTVREVRGAYLKKAATRGKRARCAFCGKHEDKHESGGTLVHVTTKKQPNGVYVHEGCFEMRCYHEDNGECTDYLHIPVDLAKGKATGNCYQLTLELETAYELSGEQLAYMLGEYGVQYSEDCTVGAEGHHKTLVNLHGFESWLDGIQSEPFIDMTADECGMHTNLGRSNWTESDLRKIDAWKDELFQPITKHLLNHERETVRVFGRYFGYNCSKYSSNNHYAYIHLKSKWIEYRLPRFVCGTHAKWCTQMLIDWNEVLNSFISGEIVPKKAGDKLVKIFDKYASGKALIQRPERNNGWHWEEYIAAWGL